MLVYLKNPDIWAMVGLGVLVVIITRFLMINGLERLADATSMRSKTRGQILGYATSTPELVGTVSTAYHGLLGAGLWNIAASNIINLFLFGAAALRYRRARAVVRVKFLDEMGFALGAIMLPILLVWKGDWAASPWAAMGLFVYFILYVIMDPLLNPTAESGEDENTPTDWRKAGVGIALLLVGILGIVYTGNALGTVADRVVNALAIPEMAIGWILGVITSLPELTTFFAVFSVGRSGEDDADVQQNLDNLAASNMSNVGLIYPIGIAVFLIFAI